MNPKICLLVLLSSCSFLACSDDETSDESGADMRAPDVERDMSPGCLPNERFNPALGKCVPAFSEPDMSGGDSDMGEDPVEDMGDTPREDMGGGECFETLLHLDEDGDGIGVDAEATNIMACLGVDDFKDGYARSSGDCDDSNRLRFPGAIEICDELDNDCDGEVNQGIECVFYAHGPRNDQSPQGSNGTFYTIDPFKKKIEYLGDIFTEDSLLDIDSHPDTDKLYGISHDTLYRYDFIAGSFVWNEVGPLQQDLQGANGLAIDRSGVAFATARDELFSVDLETGRATKLDNLTGGVESSGDCVVNKGDILFMTSKQQDPSEPDDLVRINRTNSTTEIVGRTSHARIFGLTAAWGKLYGVTLAGELIEIDQVSGASTLLTTFEGRAFYGAASTPGR